MRVWYVMAYTRKATVILTDFFRLSAFTGKTTEALLTLPHTYFSTVTSFRVAFSLAMVRPKEVL